MIPEGGNNGWASELITTVLLHPRQQDRNPNKAYSRKTRKSEIGTATLTISETIIIQNEDETIVDEIVVGDASNVDLAYDQLDRHCVAWEMPGNKIFLYWFNPLISGYEITEIAEGNNPCCQLDDYRSIYIPSSDILIFYQRGDEVFYRLQRDRYLIEYQVPHELQDLRLETCGMGTNLRFTVRVTSVDGIVLAAGQTPIRVGNNYVGLYWGEIPWAKSSSNTET